MTSSELPSTSSVVVIGGGIIGCSVLYHLSKLGFTDAILLEKTEISAGTTWHSAATVPLARSTHSMTKLAQYSAGLYSSLEKETGQATGWRVTGQLDTAPSDGWMAALELKVSRAHAFGVEAKLVTPDEAGVLFPLLRTDDLKGGAWFPDTGRIDPTDTCQALARGARANGGRIYQGVEVVGFDIVNGSVRAVHTDHGAVRCDVVVNCAGLWGRKVAMMAGVAAPLFACEHIYAITEPIDGIQSDLANLRSDFTYVREEVGGLLVGFFEPNPKVLPLDRLPENEAYIRLSEDLDHFLPLLALAAHRIPVLETIGYKTFFSGPESFTPDHEPLLGEAPEVKGFFLACGFNSSGIILGGGVGWATAEWVKTGHPPVDLSIADIKRYGPLESNSQIIIQRIPEVLGNTFEIPWPNHQYRSARHIRRSPFYRALAARGAHFSQSAMWERPSFFAPPGETPKIIEAFGRQNWFLWSTEEHRAVREGVGLFDLSPFTKLLVQGRDAERFMQRVSGNDMAVANGKIVYTAILNDRGGFESDLTVTRMTEDEYLVVTGSKERTHIHSWLRRQARDDEFVSVADITAGSSVLVLAGPESRRLLARLTPAEVDNDAFPFGRSKEIELGHCAARANRTAYHGELGYELYIPTETAAAVFDEIVEKVEPEELQFAGDFALESLRIEKGFRGWGQDIGPRDTPLEAGLGFALKLGSNIDFIGKEALLRQSDRGISRRFTSFVFEDVDAYPTDAHPIYRNGSICGHTTSSAFGHTIGHAVSLGWVESGSVSQDDLLSDRYEIEVGTTRYKVTPSLRAPYDPTGNRMRS